MCGVGLVFPVIALMTDPDIVTKYPLIQPVLIFFNYPSQTQLICGAMMCLVVFYCIKVIFLAYLGWRKISFTNDLRVYFSRKLFSGYLQQPYTFHLQHNSANLIRNITGDVKSFNKGILSIMDLVTDGLILIGVFTLLFWAEPLGAVSITIFLGITAFLLHRITKNRLSKWGKLARHHNAQLFQHLLQGLGGVKELQLLGRAQEFKVQFHIHNKGVAKLEKRQKLFSSLPRLSFELLIIIGITGLVVSLLAQKRSPGELVPILGVFAAAAFRLMPSLVKIVVALQSLRFYRQPVEKLYEEFATLSAHSANSSEEKVIRNTNCVMDRWNQLDFKLVGYSYPNDTKSVLRDISLSINRNESVGFVGGSGAGKSTLIDIMLGLLSPTTGDIFIDNRNINECLREWQDQIGYVPQTIYLTDDTIRRNIAFGLAEDKIDDHLIKEAVRAAQLEEFIDNLDEKVNTVVGEHGVRLSGGQRQRIGIARALYHNPSILVLDEATSALDVNTENEVMKAVDALHGDKTIIIIAHRTTTVSKCDKLYKVENGEIIQQGSYEEVIGL